MLLKVKINTFYYLCGHIIFVPQYKVPDLTSSMKVAQPLSIDRVLSFMPIEYDLIYYAIHIDYL